MKKTTKKTETKRKWSELTVEERKRLIALADSLYISPMFVAQMYENGQIS